MSCISLTFLDHIFMIASASRIPEDEINNDTFFSILQLNFKLKENVSEWESNWCFWKNVKIMSTKVYLGPPSRHSHFLKFLILPGKMVELPEQNVNKLSVACKPIRWSSLEFSAVANCSKYGSILNMAKFLYLPLKTY